MKKLVVFVLAGIGAIWLAFFAFRVLSAATDKQGFWWAYSCRYMPVTFSEVDTNRDKRVQRQEASLACDTYVLKRSIAGKVCFEYLEPKTGVPLQTMCRNDSASAP